MFLLKHHHYLQAAIATLVVSLGTVTRYPYSSTEVDFRRYLKSNYFSRVILWLIGENYAQIGHELFGNYSDIHLICQRKTTAPGNLLPVPSLTTLRTTIRQNYIL
jgi:hypothetical protein